MGLAFTLRQLGPADAASYRDLRLEGLRTHPEAVGASWEDETEQPRGWFADRLEAGVVFGGWSAEGDLLGVAGLMVPAQAKLRHKGVLWGMFVRPDARGTGLAAALVGRVAAEASDTLEEVQLTVTASNAAAVRLYSRLGFRQYGLERRALRVGDQYHDIVLMALPLAGPGAGVA